MESIEGVEWEELVIPVVRESKPEGCMGYTRGCLDSSLRAKSVILHMYLYNS